MALVKCGECGHNFYDCNQICPMCGATYAGEVSDESINETVEGKEHLSQDCCHGLKDMPTTDTEYKHEKVIKGYATVLFWLIVVLTILSCVVTFIFSLYSGNIQFAFLFLLYGILIMIPLSVVVAYIIRAFLMVYSNISINLHEINMKLQ